MIGWLRPAPFAEPLPAGDVDPSYRSLRRRVFAGIFVGYAGYYLVRNNLALAIPDLLREHPEYTKAALGTALTGLSIAYGVSKFLMGSVSDRSNPKYFLPLGLLLSSAIMAAFGLFDAARATLVTIIVIQAVNGWVQGMGWPPCGKTMVHWFSTKERGLTVSTWNVAHNVGGALVANLALVGVLLFHDWGAKFYFNALIAALIADRRLVPAGGHAAVARPAAVEQLQERFSARLFASRTSRRSGSGEIFLEHVLPNRYLWAIAVANAFCYFVRYGVVNWIPTYLETAKGFSFQQSSIGWSLYEYAAIPGHDRLRLDLGPLVRGQTRAGDDAVHGAHAVAVLAYWFNMHGPLWIDYAALIAIGFLVYGPIMMIGLHSLDLVPKKAAGTAAGFTGFFGYVFGSAIAGTGVGWIADHWGWNGVFIDDGRLLRAHDRLQCPHAGPQGAERSAFSRPLP